MRPFVGYRQGFLRSDGQRCPERTEIRAPRAQRPDAPVAGRQNHARRVLAYEIQDRIRISRRIHGVARENDAAGTVPGLEPWGMRTAFVAASPTATRSPARPRLCVTACSAGNCRLGPGRQTLDPKAAFGIGARNRRRRYHVVLKRIS